MRFALVDSIRREASPGLSGQCPRCDSILIPKCGQLRVWHWAHRGERHCDPWWEETAWHIGWKDRFPADWREVVCPAENGEKHIADVMTPHRRAVEFQHSPIAADERHARESFYKSMVWVVNACRRKRDVQDFFGALRMVCRSPLVFRADQNACALFRDWRGRSVNVFFDFGERTEDTAEFGGPILWHLHPDPEGRVILTPITVTEFVGRLHNAKPFRRVRIKPTPAPTKPVVIHISVARPPSHPWRRRPESFQQYLRRNERSRRRF